MINSSQKDRVIAVLTKYGLKKQKMADLYLIEDGSNIAADLRGKEPQIGVWIVDKVQTENHGLSRVQDIVNEVSVAMKFKSSASEQKGSNPTPENHTSTDSAQGKKLGAGDTAAKKGTTTATCAGCSTKIMGTIDEFATLQEKYGQIYCRVCIETGKHETKTPEAKQDQKVAGNVPATPAKTPAKIIVCGVCGIEIPVQRVLDCKDEGIPVTCKGCEGKGGINMSEDTEENLRQLDMEVLNQKKDNLPAKKKQEFVVGTCEAVAAQYGIPAELTKLFFMTMDGELYIKNPGLLYLAGKKGYSRIEVTTTYDEKNLEWLAECKIYPKLTKDILEGIARLDKDIQKIAFYFATQPTNGTGRASKVSVRMSTMHAFLKEMAQTRAQNRALRAFTGYGGTSAEELPEAQLERD